MKLLPRSWYFYYGRARLYRRLFACAKVLAVIAGALGIVYLNGSETSPCARSRPLSGCNRFRAVTLRALPAGLRYVGKSRAIRRTSTGTATVSPANPGGAVDR